MKILFEASVSVLKEFLAGAITCLVVILAVGLLVSSLLYSAWLFFSLFFLIIFGVAVAVKMEEIKQWRK
ncbi:hypothetical protein vB_PsyM_KIL3b_0005 [Pseudomonas phage vB_PsyM_KIL3b]|uniref:Uncharacterized protein n=3 Tax=Pseudomonas phage vB_PsyM_KIL1 TaxID=1777065 RepID=A0A142IFS0_9CAUD|nr:hypothetical protein BH774_gp005 [Pseudomonas phage vB_PsyM_KIL1]AMR57257.1 hypothetical protein vB_PsyM_KIL1_0005 [Pseudomonas phage vB_PsyM_KIL1]AMR57577.1 hypothetical protein vB_PsyM_KIL3_0005 [Pseudomonas phage vB_PsyM_KIL3]AMR58075.1 hypothetical protein vB_PsyM_KIL3b_0005 [Pseudomonas phage vB_PsyM_KIL3b]